METLLVRLKPFDPRRRNTLRRFLYAGIVFFEDRGWYRVSKAIGEHLRGSRQLDFDEYSPQAFDVCTDAEAKVLEAREQNEVARRRYSTDTLPLVAGRGEMVTETLPARSRGRTRPAVDVDDRSEGDETP